MDDLLQEFIAETRETLEVLSGEIVGWEAAPDDRARLDAIFRFVHTIKGRLRLPRPAPPHPSQPCGRGCAVGGARRAAHRPDTALVTTILAIIDRIAEVVEAIDAGVPLDDSGEEMLIAALDPMAMSTPVPAGTGRAPMAAMLAARARRSAPSACRSTCSIT
ncbi:Hpt domain-containing protein [Sphingomonas sp. MMS24-JH45]